jgi:hypothetical protein
VGTPPVPASVLTTHPVTPNDTVGVGVLVCIGVLVGDVVGVLVGVTLGEAKALSVGVGLGVALPAQLTTRMRLFTVSDTYIVAPEGSTVRARTLVAPNMA